jgi:hypothetical protein
MVMIVIHPAPVSFIVLMKDETSTPIYKEKFVSFADARNECDKVSWDYPQAQVILMRKEGDAVQVLYTRNPLTKA